MKNFRIFFLLFFFSAFSSLADSHEKPKKTMEISTNITNIIWGGLGLNYKIALNNTVALGVGGRGHFFSLFNNLNIAGGGFGLDAKFFLSGDTFTDSWYIEPALNADFTKITANNSSLSFWSITPSVIAGHCWVWSKGFTLSLGLGLMYKHMFIDPKLLDKDIFIIKGFFPTADLAIGWAW